MDLDHEKPEEATQHDIDCWVKSASTLKKLKAYEMTLRKKIFGFFFQNPKEGTNNHVLMTGETLKGMHPIDRKVDDAAYRSIKAELEEMGVVTGNLVKYEPSLSIKEYRKLTDEQREFFDQALIIKNGSPALEITKPKEKKA